MDIKERNSLISSINDARFRVYILPEDTEYREVTIANLDKAIADFKKLTENIVNQEPIEIKPFDDYGDIFDVEEWVSEGMRGGCFIPSDGSGYWATDEGISRDHYDIFGLKPDWATKVAWYNK